MTSSSVTDFKTSLRPFRSEVLWSFSMKWHLILFPSHRQLHSGILLRFGISFPPERIDPIIERQLGFGEDVGMPLEIEYPPLRCGLARTSSEFGKTLRSGR